jgi:two-component system chemotaxis sensor kinase CheA
MNMAWELDPSLLQDFLTEAGELIERLDSDMVALEKGGEPEETKELLNGIFRALHTVKGAAGFLQLGVVTQFAHAAEDALNRLRQGDVAITPSIMDALLQSVDVLRAMVGSLNAGEQPQPCSKELIDRLHGIAESNNSSEQSAVAEASAAADGPAASGVTDGVPLSLPSQKEAILDLMVADLRESAGQIAQIASEARSGSSASVSHQLEELCEAMCRALDFFEIPDMTRVVHAAGKAAATMQENPASMPSVLVRVLGVTVLLGQLADGLEARRVRSWPTATLEQRFATLAFGAPLNDAGANDHGGDPWEVLKADGVVTGERPRTLGLPAAATTQASSTSEPETVESVERESSTKVEKTATEKSGGEKSVAEQTIRVEVSRLEKLLSLVGQLVLAKNRIGSLGRKLRADESNASIVGEVIAASGELDRLTGELQVGVMRTRMQPLAKLFDRYPRVIRDIARATGKDIELVISGKDTEVDKSVLELLADPLVHMIRNSADHGIESADRRAKSGKPAKGTITVSAQHQGSHVRVEVVDDGKGIDPDVIGRKAVEKGLATAEAVAQMSPQQIIQFIFAPGFSTAEKVTDLSGRGVGMDVVRTNVNKMGGSINVTSQVGRGSRVEILIPLTVAIMPAMVVGVAGDSYCIPLQTITEIVRSGESGSHSIGGQPVLRLRDEVLPLIELRSTLNQPKPRADTDGRFAVIVHSGSSKAGLVVDRLIGQQEIVIRPLDDEYTQGGPFSGATIRDEGDVSLILDVNQLMRRREGGSTDRAAA